jgi:AraC-like DNA-binding protein
MRNAPMVGGSLAAKRCVAAMDRRIAFIIGIIRSNLAESLSSTERSKRVNLSPTRLRELFRQETRNTPSRFLRDLRLGHAENLLATTFLSVKEIAFVTGAKNVSGFVRAFKNRHGVTPKVFSAQSQAVTTGQLEGKLDNQ